MFDLLRRCFGLLVRLFHSCARLLIENLALRQQLAVFKRKHSRPKLAAMDGCSGRRACAPGVRGKKP